MLNGKFDEVKKRNIRILLVNSTESYRSVERIMKRMGIRYDVVVDKTGKFARKFKIFGEPTFVFCYDGSSIKRTSSFGKEVFENMLFVYDEIDRLIKDENVPLEEILEKKNEIFGARNG
jgi:hypothetical protein